MTPSEETPRRRVTDAVDNYCANFCRRDKEIGRNAEDIQSVWKAIDRMTGWVIGGAGASILCLISVIASLVIPLILKAIGGP